MIIIDGQNVEQVNQLKYLTSITVEDTYLLNDND